VVILFLQIPHPGLNYLPPTKEEIGRSRHLQSSFPLPPQFPLPRTNQWITTPRDPKFAFYSANSLLPSALNCPDVSQSYNSTDQQQICESKLGLFILILCCFLPRNLCLVISSAAFYSYAGKCLLEDIQGHEPCNHTAASMPASAGRTSHVPSAKKSKQGASIIRPIPEHKTRQRS
jgi:hypothetical protein